MILFYLKSDYLQSEIKLKYWIDINFKKWATQVIYPIFRKERWEICLRSMERKESKLPSIPAASQ